VAGFIVTTLGSGEGSVSIFEDALQFFLEFLSLISTTESFISNDSLKVEFSTDLVSGGEDVVQVKIFDERLNSSSLLDLLLGHNLSDSSGGSFDTSDQSVTELSFFVAFFSGLDDDTLLASESSLEDDDDSSVFNARKMRNVLKEGDVQFSHCFGLLAS